MNKETSRVGVFIIESLSFSNEKADLFEGKMLSNILQLNQIANEYYYIRTKQELEEVIKEFQKSNLRYLHISCHGAEKAIALTLDDVPYNDLGIILKPYIKKRRIFLSACSSVNNHIAAAVIPRGECYSIIGPTNDIEFRDANIMWSSFYHLMFKGNAEYMLRDDLIKNIQKIVNTFGQPMTYYSWSKSKGVKRTGFKVQTTTTTINESTQLE